MKVSDLKNSRYLAKEDVMPDRLVTIDHMTHEDVAMESEPQKMRWVMSFREGDVKPMVLNPTNGQTIEAITGSDDSDDWAGWHIVVYNDPTITFGGKRTGGVRVRAPSPAFLQKHGIVQPARLSRPEPPPTLRTQPQPPPREFDQSMDRMYGSQETHHAGPIEVADDDIPF